MKKTDQAQQKQSGGQKKPHDLPVTTRPFGVKRKGMVETLRASEHKFRETVNYLVEGYYSCTMDGILLDHNLAFNRLLGYDVSQDLIGTKLADFWQNPEDRKGYLTELMTNGVVSSYLIKAKTIGGVKFVVLANSHLVKDDQGKPLKIEGTFTDFTERKRMEDTLIGNEAKYRVLFENAQVGIYRTNLDEETIRSLARFPAENPNPVLRIAQDGNLLYANDAALLLLSDLKLEVGKLAPEILIGLASKVLNTRTPKTGEISSGNRTFTFSIAPAPGDAYANLYARDDTERVRAEQEIRSLNAELEQRVADRTEQLQTVNKQLESELAERKRAEEALRESEERFRHLSEAAFEAIVIHDRGILLNANTQYIKMFGYELEELMGKQVMPMTIAPEAIEAVKIEIAAGGVGPYESIGQRKDGTRFPMEIRVRELEFEGRKVRVAAIMDITERKRAGEALQQRTTQLETANKELEAFSYSISHDLRAPLRAMDGFSRILLEEHGPRLSAEAQRYLGLVRENAQQMGHLIEDLLAFSRLSRQPLNKQTVAMADVVRQVLAELHVEQEGQNAIVTIGDLPVCEADPALLKQVWINLLSNALKFTRKCEAAHIEVGILPYPSLLSPLLTGDEDDGPVFFVKDNGVGFDMQYASKLFGVFQRLHRAEDYEGTGVGLAIVQRIVNRHGGRVWTEADIDKGAAFYFTLGGDA